MAAAGRFSGISPSFGLPVLRSERGLCRAVQVPIAGVAGAGVVPCAVVFLVPGVMGGDVLGGSTSGPVGASR